MRWHGILLAYHNFGESDRYVQFLTKEKGIVTLLAKGARKSKRRYVGGLDLFCHDELSVQGHERFYLRELKVINPFWALRSDLNRLLTVGRMVQWVQMIARVWPPMMECYYLLGQLIALTEKIETLEEGAFLLLLFRVKLLLSLGIRPRFSYCVRCNQGLKAGGEHFFI